MLPPTPTSAGISTSAPESASASAIAMPRRNASSISSRVAASSLSMRPDGRPTATSTTRTVAPCSRARTPTAPPPSSICFTRAAVTACAWSGAVADTPSAATPWSPANTTTRARSIGRA